MNAPFDAGAALLVDPPPDLAPGHWAGAPGSFSDGDTVFLVYRLRWPRPRRGGELRVARGDGERFKTIWRATREDFGSPSIERCAILRDGRTWRLYVSYVDGVDGRWRIDVIEAGSAHSFDPAARRLALDADVAKAVAVKDPWLRRVDDRWWMFVSYGERPPGDERKLHGSGDALSTGAVKSETGLATSADGLRWKWEGRVFAASAKGWDKATARLTTAFRSGDEWIGLYDGASDISENYEERCGMARSTDLRTWERIGSGPAVGAAGGPGTVRYVESVVVGDSVRFFFERTRADGSHELCTSSTPLSEWDRGNPG
ncbi:MAG TPA: hypothetical protein VK732_04245 [Verrucomicrobiae bacterium]|nr:hypothetical protein [Verrucomicrobiae bacterium]